MKKVAAAGILTAGILWGMIGIFIRRLSVAGLDSLQIVGLRVMFGAALLILVTAVRDRKLLRIYWKDIWCFIGTGIAGFAFFNYCYFVTIQYTSLSVAAVLLYIAPSLVIVLSALLFKEKVTVQKVISLLLAFAGCIFAAGLFTGETSLNTAGFLLGLGSGLGYALVTVFTRYALNRGYASETIVIYTMLFASAGVCCVTDVRPVFRYVFSGYQEFGFSILFVLVSTIMPNLLYTWGLSRLENGMATIIVSVEPVAATVAGAVAYQEALSPGGYAGIFLMCVSFVVLNLNTKRKTPDGSSHINGTAQV